MGRVENYSRFCFRTKRFLRSIPFGGFVVLSTVELVSVGFLLFSSKEISISPSVILVDKRREEFVRDSSFVLFVATLSEPTRFFILVTGPCASHIFFLSL